MRTLALLDYCLPDYFSGYSKPVIAVSVYGTMTNEEVSDAIKDELNICFDMYEGETADFADKYCEELMREPEKIFIEQEPLEDEYCECAYLYFGVVNPVHKYGLTFLNP